MFDEAKLIRAYTAEGSCAAHPRRYPFGHNRTFMMGIISEVPLTPNDKQLVTATITPRSQEQAPLIVDDINTLVGYFATAYPLEQLSA
jgi:hypothetical protein